VDGAGDAATATAAVRAALAGATAALAAESRAGMEARLDEQRAASTAAEVLQYERRFSELYEHMSRRTDEHRDLNATFNSVQARADIHREALKLMRALERAATGSVDPAQRGEVLRSLDVPLQRKRERVLAAAAARDKLESESSALLARQRAFAKSLRQLDQLCAALSPA